MSRVETQRCMPVLGVLLGRMVQLKSDGAMQVHLMQWLKVVSLELASNSSRRDIP